jgi:hypothetical protein
MADGVVLSSGAITVRVDFRELRLAAALLGKTPGELRRLVRRALVEVGRTAQRAMKAEFAARLTDPSSRRRTDRSARVGRFSGAARRAITVRVRFRDREGSWKVFVGPRGGAGIPGPGFYLAFHEFGYGRFPRRGVAAPAESKIRPAAERKVEGIVDRILGGW